MARVFQGGPEPKDPRICEAPKPRPQWHDVRFIESPTKARVECLECGKPMWLPPSKVAMYQRCGQECQNAYTRRGKVARTRPCETCGKVFTPRSTQVAAGTGRFCSQKCNTAGAAALQSPEARANHVEGVRAAILDGRIKRPKGEQNPRWLGGLAGQRLRAKSPEGRAASAARLRRYRAANPDKVREWRHDRRFKKGSRLPRGTVKAIGNAQRWRCAVCAVSLKKGYHLDHIQPLARDGKHIPRNLQLLCGPCNLQKNAKDPIDFMREKGRLL